MITIRVASPTDAQLLPLWARAAIRPGEGSVIEMNGGVVAVADEYGSVTLGPEVSQGYRNQRIRAQLEDGLGVLWDFYARTRG